MAGTKKDYFWDSKINLIQLMKDNITDKIHT